MTHGERVAGGGRRWSRSVLSALTIALIACMSEVDGERASSGECPEDEVCSEATNQGLRFVGNAFWDDDEELLLGPVLVGGTFEIGLKTVDGEPLPDFDIEVDDGRIFSVERGAGVFGPTTRSGRALHPVDGHMVLSGIGPGSTLIRIVDPDTGELFDRLRVEAYEIEDISITNMNDPQRSYVVAGCDEMLAVRLLAKDGDVELRAFDQSVQLRAEGQVRAEPEFWDCFNYRAPEGRAEVSVEVEAAGKTFARALEVRTLAEVGLRAARRSNVAISIEFGGFRSPREPVPLALALARYRNKLQTNGTVGPGKGTGKRRGQHLGSSRITAHHVRVQKAALVSSSTASGLRNRAGRPCGQAGRSHTLQPMPRASPRSDRANRAPCCSTRQ